LRPWLVTIVANAARTRRSAAARRPVMVLDGSTATAVVSPEPSPEAAAVSAEASRELLAAVNALRDDDRRVIVSRYFLELSESESAAVLGCAKGTVKSRQSRALGRLRQQLRANEPAAGETHG
jgi:RNA polymerase sigma-70 factor (ECF subfamily)